MYIHIIYIYIYICAAASLQSLCHLCALPQTVATIERGLKFGALIRGHSKRGLSKRSTILDKILLFVVLLLSPLLLSPNRGSRKTPSFPQANSLP